MQYLAIYLVVVNVIAYIVYALDKKKARRGAWRISEKTLILLAAIGGAGGAWLAMQVLRHKTKHVKFMVGVPVCMLLWAGILTVLLIKLH